MSKGMYEDNGEWVIDKRHNGVRIFERTYTSSKRIAEQVLSRFIVEVERGEYQLWKKKFDVFADEYKAGLDLGKPNHIRYEIIVRHTLIPVFGGMRISEIIGYNSKTGKSFLGDYLNEIASKPKNTAKKIRVVLKAIIKLADKSFEFPEPKYLNKGFYQTRFMSVDELNEMVSLLDDQHQALALVLAYSGMDLGDGVKLRWRQVDFKNQVIRYARGKTEHNDESVEIEVPMSKAVSDVLAFRSRVRKLHDDRVFNLTGQAFQKAWKRALKKSTVDWHVRVKDLRHFFGSYMLNKGVDSLMVANLMGHSSPNMLRKRYGHYTLESKRLAIGSFDDESPAEVPQRMNDDK